MYGHWKTKIELNINRTRVFSQNIVATIEASWHTMLKQLLAQLRADLQLPKCLQVVGYLRRMQAFTPAELRLIFLQSRDAWLTRILAAIPVADRAHHLSKTVELTRVNLFTIVTQYKATFADDDAADAGDSESIDAAAAAAASADSDNGAGSHVFHAWLTAKIDTFLRTLEDDLQACATSIDSIDTVLGQCMYFGLSFSRVGVDFRGLMAPIFANVILAKFCGAVQATQRQFEADMERFTLINKMAVPATNVAGTAEADALLLPPESLLDFTPLAVFCNGLLSALNDLRPCAPVAVAQSVTAALQSALVAAARAVHQFHRQEQQAFGTAERENFQRMAGALCDDLVPFVQRCVHAVFPSDVLQAQLGLSAVQLQREALTLLRHAEIAQPLVAFLPAVSRVDVDVLATALERVAVDDAVDVVAVGEAVDVVAVNDEAAEKRMENVEIDVVEKASVNVEAEEKTTES